MASAIDSVVMKTLNHSTQFITEHLYFPLEVAIPNYIVNEWSVTFLLSVFFGGLALIFLGTYTFVNRNHPYLPTVEKAAIWWLILCMSYL